MVVAATWAAALVGTQPAVAAPTYYWSVPQVLRMIDGARITMHGRVVRVKSESALCSGEGPSRRRGGLRMWRRFACTYTTFTKAGVDRDVDFRVWVTGPRRFVIYDAHWVGATR
jgi:hypothetical protein